MKNNLRVWWIPQVPMSAFYVPVNDVDEAIKVLDILAKYDIFQYENNIKPDYCNAGGLQEYILEYGETDDERWVDWHDPLTDDDIDEYIENKKIYESV